MPFQSQERLAPIFKRFAVLCTRHAICGRGHCLWAIRDRAVGEGGGAGVGGRMNRLRERQGDRGIAAELRSWGAPGLAARGHPSEGGMGRLLTREIKSGRDREYLYAHLLALREDASSPGRLRNYTFPDS